ncbi:hypothetical protein LF1_23250 [Rubripirellula obstinata]|uniref:Uncharacterized protein n=1 Tax=Rubripirellula obstinata TaxID=406547 RepID=A0A5B1CF43_9BACT|nr:hypothetical protein LF1_23250 [Rubripirellula obstinata]
MLVVVIPDKLRGRDLSFFYALIPIEKTPRHLSIAVGLCRS